MVYAAKTYPTQHPIIYTGCTMINPTSKKLCITTKCIYMQVDDIAGVHVNNNIITELMKPASKKEC